MDSVLPGLDAAPNIHPLFVHFPVALWPVALVAMAFAYIKKDDKAYQFGTALLGASVLAGLAAALTGWLASDAMGHDHPGHELIHDHRNLMLAALLVSLGAGGAAWWCRRPERRSRRWIPVGCVPSAGVLEMRFLAKPNWTRVDPSVPEAHHEIPNLAGAPTLASTRPAA